MIFQRILVVALFVVLTSCQSSEVYVSSEAEDKSIMVPPGIRGTSGAVKRVFASNGWATYVAGVQTQTTGTIGQYVNIRTGQKFPARYSAITAQNQVDICLDLKPFLQYDISIIDNKTGQEVAAFSGTACEGQIEKQLAKELKSFL